ncbi:hypothetical protein OROMI_014606 [Orobanche minor]
MPDATSIMTIRNPHVGNASCSYILNSASSSDRNARRRALYASMQDDKKASLLLARMSVSTQHEVSLDSAMEFPTSCKEWKLFLRRPGLCLLSLIPPVGNLDLKIFEDIDEMMQLNPYAIFFRSLLELTNLQDYNIVLRADPCLDMRIYSLPTAHQVAAIWNEFTGIPADHPHDIRECTSAGKTHRVHYYYGCYDPLQYPLLFPYGESGWHTGIVKLAPVSNGYQGQQYHKCDGQNMISLDQEHCGESVLAHELQSMNLSIFIIKQLALIEVYRWTGSFTSVSRIWGARYIGRQSCDRTDAKEDDYESLDGLAR